VGLRDDFVREYDEDDEPDLAGRVVRATGVRWGVLALTTAMAVILYLDRVCMSVAGPRIAEELGRLDKREMGLVHGSFFFAYALMQIPGGWLGDRFGARLMLPACVLAWSLFTGLTALATGLVTLIAARLLFGAAQAGAYPTAARVNSVWMPLATRGLASSIISLGGRAGGTLAPVLTAWLILAFAGWRPVFWAYALVGVGWAAFFAWWFRETPAAHPACNEAEVELIRGGGTSTTAGPAQGLPWAAACRSPGLWLQCLTQFTGNIPWTFLITFAPAFLREEYGVDETRSGELASLPLLAGMVGCFLGGLATDLLVRHLGLRWGRALMGIASKLLAAVGLLLAVAAGDPILATLALMFMSLTMDTGLGATWAYFQDAGGRYVGTLLGWANMFGNLGSFVSPILLGWLAEEYGWAPALSLYAGLFLASAACWLGIDARVPIIPEPGPGESPVGPAPRR
jgi:ACS family glucarate transporter-like MFS transporter